MRGNRERERERESEKISLASQPHRMSEWYWYLLMTRQSYTVSCSNMFSSFADKKDPKVKMCCTITISSNALISILQKLIWSTTEAAHLRLNWPGSLFWRQVCSRYEVWRSLVQQWMACWSPQASKPKWQSLRRSWICFWDIKWPETRNLFAH